MELKSTSCCTISNCCKTVEQVAVTAMFIVSLAYSWVVAAVARLIQNCRTWIGGGGGSHKN